MRKVLIALSALALLGGGVLSACGSSEADVVKARTAAQTVNGLCPVRKELVVPGVFVEHEGQLIGFCCPPCKAEFSAEPDMYLDTMRADRDRFSYIGR